MPVAIRAVQAAGNLLKDHFASNSHFTNLDEIVAAIHASDQVSLSAMREALLDARPVSKWVEDELESGELPPGEWWIADPVEGNINYIHGMIDWCVTATLVSDNIPVLTVVYLPLTGNIYTAVRNTGAYLDGNQLLRPSSVRRTT